MKTRRSKLFRLYKMTYYDMVRLFFGAYPRHSDKEAIVWGIILFTLFCLGMAAGWSGMY